MRNSILYVGSRVRHSISIKLTGTITKIQTEKTFERDWSNNDFLEYDFFRMKEKAIIYYWVLFDGRDNAMPFFKKYLTKI